MPLRAIRQALARRFFPDREGFRTAPADDATRRAAWFDFLFVDFGFLRLFWKNAARISARAIRMNQPFPGDIDKAADAGVKTIVTARHDPRHGGNALVAAAAARRGIAYETFPLFSRDAPSKAALLSAPDFFQRIEYPALFHCKSGADRAGFLAALYLIVAEGVPVSLARKQLSLRFLHIRASQTGILDAVFDTYLAAHPDEKMPFLEWVRDDYDPAALKAAFRAGTLADFFDRILLRRE
jgi:protein tyrosine/serine phosphatase